MARCYIKNHPNYKFYGAKGVKVSERWRSFDNFIYDIDNIMPNGHLLYSPDYQLDKDKKVECCIPSKIAVLYLLRKIEK